jgi:hypothetical protein
MSSWEAAIFQLPSAAAMLVSRPLAGLKSREIWPLLRGERSAARPLT